MLEELGRVCVPGPFLPTVVAATAIDRWGADPSLAADLAPGRSSAASRPGPTWRRRRRARQRRRRGVWGGPSAGRFVLPVPTAGAGRRPAAGAWSTGPRSRCDALPGFDPTRRVTEVRLDGVRVPDDRWLARLADGRGRPARSGWPSVLAGAEAVGVADWCVDTAAEYARVRVQFGRPIGQFQAVKHRCADMLVALEAARAAVWDAARAFDDADEPRLGGGPAAWPPPLATEAGFRCAKDCIQVLGGIGYTWEHDAHIYLKRATALRRCCRRRRRRRPVAAAVAGGRGTARCRIELPAEAEPARARTRELVERPPPARQGASGERPAGRVRLPGAPLARAVGPRRRPRSSSSSSTRS